MESLDILFAACEAEQLLSEITDPEVNIVWTTVYSDRSTLGIDACGKSKRKI